MPLCAAAVLLSRAESAVQSITRADFCAARPLQGVETVPGLFALSVLVAVCASGELRCAGVGRCCV